MTKPKKARGSASSKTSILSRNRPNKVRKQTAEESSDNETSHTTGESRSEQETTDISSSSASAAGTSHRLRSQGGSKAVPESLKSIKSEVSSETGNDHDGSSDVFNFSPELQNAKSNKGKYAVNGNNKTQHIDEEMRNKYDPEMISFIKKENADSIHTTSYSGSTTANSSNNDGGRKVDLIVGVDIEDSFNKYMSQMDSEQYPNIVENYEKNGYRLKAPELQEIEHEIILEQKKLKTETVLGLRQFQSCIDFSLGMAKNTELMEMSIEDVLTMVEKSRNTTIDTFSDLVAHMVLVSAEEVEAASGGRPMDYGDEDMFAETDPIPDTPPPSEQNLPTISKVGSQVAKITEARLFPSPASMMKNRSHDKFVTPGASLFRFGAVPPSTNKAPRLLKPNEIVFSQSGSPLIVPKLNNFAGRAVAGDDKISVKDGDGKRIVDVVFIQGEEENRTEFKTVVNSIKSMVKLQSTAKRNRIQEPRLARLPPKGVQSSASKKDNKPKWH